VPRARIATSLLLPFLLAAPAAAEGVFCSPISAVPATITAQGRYCVTVPLVYAAGGGVAIWVQSDFVTIDLGGFTLDGSGYGPATTATGIYALKRRNLVIRNGRLRGFMYGIRLDDDAATGYTAGGGHQVEDVQVDACTVRPIWVQGRGNRVRGSVVTRSGGSTFYSSIGVIGIETRGPGVRVTGNSVLETRGVGTGAAWGIFAAGPDAILEGNRVANESVGAASVGILARTGSTAQVLGDRVANFARGVQFEPGAGGLARDNATTGCTVPYDLGGATDGGHNN
jgi:hypothetical protein